MGGLSNLATAFSPVYAGYKAISGGGMSPTSGVVGLAGSLLNKKKPTAAPTANPNPQAPMGSSQPPLTSGFADSNTGGTYG